MMAHAFLLFLAASLLTQCAEPQMPRTPAERRDFCAELSRRNSDVDRMPGSALDRAAFHAQLADWAVQAECPGARRVVIDVSEFE